MLKIPGIFQQLNYLIPRTIDIYFSGIVQSKEVLFQDIKIEGFAVLKMC